tara:strand:- start:4709 stop:5356 length:648 start_codon:yes stop_codon:yes gene_type:complete
MPNPNSAVSTELDAVNQILSSVGQAPVLDLDMQNPEVNICLQTLRDTNRQLQAEGWTFNTEYLVKFTPDANKKITIADDVLQIDSNESRHFNNYNLIRRLDTSDNTNKLYDRFWHQKNKTEGYTFDEDIYCDVVYFIRFDNLPYAFQAHIIARAARQVSIKLVGSAELVQLLAVEEDQTRAALMEYETNQGDYSIFGSKDGLHYNSYQPFKALAR